MALQKNSSGGIEMKLVENILRFEEHFQNVERAKDVEK